MKKFYKITMNDVLRSSRKTSYTIFLFLSIITNSVVAKKLSTGEKHLNVITVCTDPVITKAPSSSTICAGDNITFSIIATGATSYKWQINTGSGFTDLVNGGAYSGVTTANLTITGATTNMNNYAFRAIAIDGACSAISSNASLGINIPPVITQNPFPEAICEGNGVLFYIAASNTNSYQWQVSINEGVNWSNISDGAGPNGGIYSGANSAVLFITNSAVTMNGYRYRCVASGCSVSATSSGATLTVYDCNSPITVTNVTANTANDSYGEGSIISINIVFDGIVTVTGVPQLLLETGATDRYASYSTGSGSNTLVFNYTVQSGDESLDLDYKSINALSLNGGSIKNTFAGNAVLTLPSPGAAGSLAANSDIIIAAPLPVGLIGFNVKSSNTGTVELTWITANELDNAYFEILRSADGLHFELISKIVGAGNSTIQHNYQIFDNQPLNGINYYRLIQYDLDGKSIILGDKVVNMSFTKENSIVVFPNPTSATVNIIFEAGKYTKADILDFSGKVLETKNVETKQNSLSFDLKNLANGIYLLKLNGQNGSITKQILKN